jgi:hypothetical protein
MLDSSKRPYIMSNIWLQRRLKMQSIQISRRATCTLQENSCDPKHLPGLIPAPEHGNPFSKIIVQLLVDQYDISCGRARTGSGLH